VTSRTRVDDAGGAGRPLAEDALIPGADAESFDAFYAREYRSLVALAHALTGSRSHAEDIAQEAMLAAYRRWDGVALLDAPAGWVRRVCANISTSFVRRRIVEARAAVRLRNQRTAVTELEDDDAEFWSVVRRLPRRQMQCVALRYVFGYTVAEIAIVLGCADGTVKAHLARAKFTLAQRMSEPIVEEAAP
jgi:RNA polymerase sigma-70 factor (sigma-E family)